MPNKRIKWAEADQSSGKESFRLAIVRRRTAVHRALGGGEFRRERSQDRRSVPQKIIIIINTE